MYSTHSLYSQGGVLELELEYMCAGTELSFRKGGDDVTAANKYVGGRYHYPEER
jgi:hypothetical protein